MPYIFLDESGNFTKSSDSKHFVVASFTVSEPTLTEKVFRKWRKTRFPKSMRHLSEVKFSHPTISPQLRLKTLREISKLNVQIRLFYLKHENIPEEYSRKDSLESGHLYKHIIAETVESYLPSLDPELRVFCDQRSLKGIKTGEFKKALRLHFLPKMPLKSLIVIEMVNSTHSVNIQIADWLAGAFAAYLEGKPGGEDYYILLRNNILSITELFKESPFTP